MVSIKAHYQTDLGKFYYLFPYSAYIDTSKEVINPFEVSELIPQSIKNLLIYNARVICPEKGINPRYLEIFDTKDNRYIMECPLPWGQMPLLFDQLKNDIRLKGYVAHGETIKYAQLIKNI